MKHIKIIDFTNKLNYTELERIGNFLKTSGKIKPEVLLLYNEIQQNNLLQQKSTKEKLWKGVFGKLKLNENIFRKLCFELLQEIEKAIPSLYLDINKTERHLQLLRYLSVMSPELFFDEKWFKIKKDTAQENELLSTQQLYFHYSMELIRYNHLIDNPAKAHIHNINATSATLDDYYILQKLKLICHAINESTFTTYNEMPAFSSTVIEMAASVKNDLIDIYRNIYFLLSETESDTIFFDIKKKIETLDLIDADELRIIFQYLINYCIFNLNKGKSGFISELFDIYKSYVEKIYDEVFSPARYTNIVNVSLKQKEYDFAAYFIDAFGKKLPADIQETYIAYNKAKLQYELRNFDEVISTLQKVKNNDLTFNLNAKVLLVKTFYEKKEFQFLENYMLSFKAYILRNKEMNTINKQIHLNFLKMMKKLMGMEYNSKIAVEKFRQKIEAFPNLPDKSWLLEKIDLL